MFVYVYTAALNEINFCVTVGNKVGEGLTSPTYLGAMYIFLKLLVAVYSSLFLTEMRQPCVHDCWSYAYPRAIPSLLGKGV